MIYRYIFLSKISLSILFITLGFLTACSTTADSPSVIAAPALNTPVPPSATIPASNTAPLPSEASPSMTPTESASTIRTNTAVAPTFSPTLPALSLTPTPDLRLAPKRWREWPSIPTVSARAYEIYQFGLNLGNDPHAFSRVGDCESAPAAFLGFYVEEWAWLPSDYQHLQVAIDHFYNSFSRDNITARDGFGVSSVLSPLMADPSVCHNNETPLECEYRLHKPSLTFIGMGTNWAPYAGASYEQYLQQIVEFNIEHGTLPILMTKADNIELDHSINAAIAQVAYDYDIPMLNFWRIAHALPNYGLEEDGAHLTTQAEDSRNFHGLITLYTVWDQLSNWDQN